MNAENKAKIRKETKRKIKADFERSPLKDRLKAKFLNGFFFQKIAVKLFIYVILIGVCFVILFPFISKISGSFMTTDDLMDSTVRLIPKHFTFDIYKAIWEEQDYLEAFGNTLGLSLLCAIIQTFICCVVAYGFAKFKFRGNKILFACVILTMLIPHRTLGISMSSAFREFDIFQVFPIAKEGFASIGAAFSNMFSHSEGIKTGFYENFQVVGVIGFINELGLFEWFTQTVQKMSDGLLAMFESMGMVRGGMIYLFGTIDWMEVTEFTKMFKDITLAGRFSSDGVNTLNTYWPFVILSLTGLAFKNGLYIYLLRQFFMGVPDELEESAYIDGSGVFRTFFTIILPISVPMMITVFLFSFSWTWMDNFYSSIQMFSQSPLANAPYLLTTKIGTAIPGSMVDAEPNVQQLYFAAVRNTGGLMIIAPLVVMYIFCQRYLVQGIERSGLTAD